MFMIFLRLFLRLTVLVFVIFSIFFFHVFWYKYDKQRWFIKNSGVYDIKYFSDNNFEKSIIINSQKYYVVDNKLTIYWLEKNQCWYIKIWNYKKYDCYDGKRYSNIIYIPSSSVKIYPITKNIVFLKLDLKISKDYCINYDFNWNGIEMSYYKDGTIVYKDDISSKKLTNIKWANFVWYNDNWLFFSLNDKIYFMEILVNL